MAYIGFLLILAIPAAAPPNTSAPSRQPFVIQFNDGSEIVGFWDEKEIQGGGRARIELDTPWIPGTQRRIIVLDEVASAVSERPTITAARIRRGWTDAGYVLVNDSLPVPAEDYKRALRARELAGLDQQDGGGHDAERDEPPAAETVAPAASAPVMPGFFEQWGAHIGLVLVTVLLTGLIVRLTILSAE